MRYACISVVLLVAACGKGAESTGAPRCDGVRAGKSFLTYNVALGPGMVPLSRLRAPVVIDALRKTAFDVACLQEVWSPAQAKAIRDGLLLTEQQSFYGDTTGLRETGKDVCRKEQLEAVSACAAKHCGNEPATEEVSICVRKECASQLGGILASRGGKACVSCLVAMAGASVAETRATCTSEDGASRIHGGASSAMIVAKAGRLYNKEPMLLESSGSNRTALFATIRVQDQFGRDREMEVACAHLSASASIPPTHSGYASWEDEKRAQLHAILTKLDERALRKDDASVPTVFLGDYNVDPTSSPALWSVVTTAGYVCPTADQVMGGGCTACGDNTLVGGNRTSLLDHVCVRNPATGDVLVTACVDRVFDQKVVMLDYDGETEIETHPSDHYGKRVLFDLRSPGFGH